LSRGSRSLPPLIEVITDPQCDGVGIYSLSEGISTLSDNPYNTVIISLFAALAQVQREQISAAVRAGLERAKSEGIKLGRKTIPINAELAVRLKREHKSLSYIQQELAKEGCRISRSSLHRKLKMIMESEDFYLSQNPDPEKVASSVS